MLMLKTVLMRRTIAQAEKTMAKPMRALVISLRAFSLPALSPPEVIHWTPPQTSLKKKTMAAITREAVTPKETILSTVMPPRDPN